MIWLETAITSAASRPSFRPWPLALLCVGVSTFALAQEPRAPYPQRPVRFIVPYAPGGPNDIVARVLAQKLSERWGQQVVVDNRGGANGIIGAELAARAAPDGYTLFLGNAGVLTTNPALYAKLPYDAEKDFTPVTLVVASPFLLVAHPSLGVRSVADLVALGKTRPAPLAFGSGGTNGVAHLAAELLKFKTGIPATHVPYKGAAPAMTDLLAGQVAFNFTGIMTALPFVKSGKLAGLAVTTKSRLTTWPDMPTVAETVPGFEVRPWYGMTAPAGTAHAIVARIDSELQTIVRTPEVVARLTADGGEITADGPQQFARIIREEIAMWAQLARQAKLKSD